MEKVEPEQSPRPQFWFAKIGAFVKIVLIGILPLSVIGLIQQSSLAHQETTRDYAVAGAMIWSILTILTVTDPFYSDKITALQNLAQFIPGGTKKSDK